MSSFSLDDIRAAADRKYGSTDIAVGDETVRLLNPLRMKKSQRDKLIGVQKEMEAGTDEAEDVDQVAVFQQALRIVAQTPAQAKLLIDAIGDWVIEELARQTRQWTDAGMVFDVSFNLSARQLWQPDLVGAVLSALGMGGIVLGILVWEDGGGAVLLLMAIGAVSLAGLAWWLERSRLGLAGAVRKNDAGRAAADAGG